MRSSKVSRCTIDCWSSGSLPPISDKTMMRLLSAYVFSIPHKVNMTNKTMILYIILRFYYKFRPFIRLNNSSMQIYSRFLIKRSILWVKIYGKPKFVIIVLHVIIGKILKQENKEVPTFKKITEFTECNECFC